MTLRYLAIIPTRGVSFATCLTKKKKKRGNERVKPDVVTFTAVIDAWVKCTALAHDYHYDQPPPPSSSSQSSASLSHNETRYREKESYAEWKVAQAAKADELTARAADRAKQLLGLMITLGHCK